VGDSLQITEVLKRKLAFPRAADRHREVFRSPAEICEGGLERFGRQVDDQPAHFTPDPAGTGLIPSNAGWQRLAHAYSFLLGYPLIGYLMGGR
jgi:hypothetical protein